MRMMVQIKMKKAKARMQRNNWNRNSKPNGKKNFGPRMMFDEDKIYITCQKYSEHPERAGTMDYISGS